MKRSSCCCSIILVVALLFLVTGTAFSADKVYKWRLQPYLPESSPNVAKNIDKLIEMIEQNTNGQVIITKHPAGSIVQGGEVLSATETGILDMSISIGGYNAGAVPAAAIEDGLPLQWMSRQQTSEVLYDYGFENLMREVYKKHGVYLLGLYMSDGVGTQIYTAKPINSLADLKGKKIRTWGAYLDLVKELGASPVSMPLGEVYSALQLGALDGILVVTAVVPSFKLYEVAPYATLPQLASSGANSVFVNSGKWDALPDQLKMIVQLTFDKWKEWNLRYYCPRFNAVTVDQLEKLGVKFTTLSEADQDSIWKAAMKIWDAKAAVDKDATKAIEIVKDQMKDTGNWKN